MFLSGFGNKSEYQQKLKKIHKSPYLWYSIKKEILERLLRKLSIWIFVQFFKQTDDCFRIDTWSQLHAQASVESAISWRTAADWQSGGNLCSNKLIVKNIKKRREYIQ